MATPQQLDYFYRIDVKRVKDGDTLEAVFDLGFRASLVVTVRMLGYDAPETYRPPTQKEADAGHQVTVYLQSILDAHKGKLFCTSHSIDVYGRSLGTLYYQDDQGNFIDINDQVSKYMIENHITKADVRA